MSQGKASQAASFPSSRDDASHCIWLPVCYSESLPSSLLILELFLSSFFKARVQPDSAFLTWLEGSYSANDVIQFCTEGGVGRRLETEGKDRLPVVSSL